MVRLASIFAAAGIAATTLVYEASAHPGQYAHTPTTAELAESHLFKTQSRRSLEACANSEASLMLKERTIARRAATLEQIRQQRRLSAADVIATSHKSNLTGITPDTDPAVYFGSEVACVLEPEVTQGPYYVTGELIRNDIREDQPGVDLYTELQIIDVNTCLPVPNLYVDFWHCNATGVYSGMIANGNGDSSDLTNVNKTFSRGLAPTDADGLVQFLTVFPGHYTGRAHHIHVLGSYNGTVLENNTYIGSVASHVGQIFFDQDLITEVESTPVYTANTQPLTTNAQDGIFGQEAATGFDPVVEYVLLGDSVEDGIFSWISIGVDMTRAESVWAAGTYTADGGIINSGGGGGGPPGPPPDGSAPPDQVQA